MARVHASHRTSKVAKPPHSAHNDDVPQPATTVRPVHMTIEQSNSPQPESNAQKVADDAALKADADATRRDRDVRLEDRPESDAEVARRRDEPPTSIVVGDTLLVREHSAADRFVRPVNGGIKPQYDESRDRDQPREVPLNPRR